MPRIDFNPWHLIFMCALLGNQPGARVPVEKVAFLILDALEKEQQREPDILKCRRLADVIEAVKVEHQIPYARFNEAIDFMCFETRQFVLSATRPDGVAMLPSNNGLYMLAKTRSAIVHCLRG